MLRRIAAPSMLLLLSACAGGSSNVAGPSASAAPAPAAVVVVSGETGQPVAGASVSAGSSRTLTDADGRASVAAASLTVSAAGFLDRQTALRSAADAQILLWPVHSGFDEGFAREMAYSGIVNPARSLTRPTSPVVLVLGAGVRDALQATARDAADAITAATDGVAPYSVGDAAPQGSIAIDVTVDANDPFFASHPGADAATELHFVNSRVTGGRITFRDVSYGRLRGAFLHELGHTFGAGHPSQFGLMNAVIDRDQRDFSPAERLALHLMAHRRPGNVFPDDDTAVSVSSASGRTVIVD